jgi:hypothetical protein
MTLAATLGGCLEEAFRRLADGVADRRSAFHAPTLATVARDGTPEARTLVLRGFEAVTRTLRLHTDARSAKVDALTHQPRCALHLYDASEGLQLRIGGFASLHSDDAIAEEAWGSSRTASRRVYALSQGPGVPVREPPPAPKDTVTGRANFRVIRIHFDCLEWLELAASGHRRALFRWGADGTASSTWLVP